LRKKLAKKEKNCATRLFDRIRETVDRNQWNAAVAHPNADSSRKMGGRANTKKKRDVSLGGGAAPPIPQQRHGENAKPTVGAR